MTLLPLEDWRAAALKGQPASSGVIRVAPSDPQEIAGATRSMRFIFSDESQDRAGDVIKAAGWSLASFTANPVALWSHDPSRPENIIGRAANVGVMGGRLMGDIEFADADVNPLADTVFRLYKGRYLNAVSVGFQPLEYEFTKDSGRPGGVDFLRHELQEISAVAIPCNQNALVVARSAGINMRPLVEWAEKILDTGGMMIVPRVEVKAMHDAASGKTMFPVHVRKEDDVARWEGCGDRELPVDEARAWDGPEASEAMLAAAGFNGDSPDAEKAKRGFMVYDAAKPLEKTSYKFPFAATVDGTLKAVRGGIDAAASRIEDSSIPDAARAHCRELVAAYEKKDGSDVSKPEDEKAARALRGKIARNFARKGLWDVGHLACLLEEMGWLTDSAQFEAEVEGDGSAVPAMLGEALQKLGAALVAMTQEEVAELIGGDDTDIVPDDTAAPVATADVALVEAAASPAVRKFRAGYAAAKRAAEPAPPGTTAPASTPRGRRLRAAIVAGL